jgi:hypothetical protein
MHSNNNIAQTMRENMKEVNVPVDIGLKCAHYRHLPIKYNLING